MQDSCTNNSRPRLLIADDHPIFGDTLKLYLERTYSVIGVVRVWPHTGRGSASSKTGSCHRRRSDARAERIGGRAKNQKVGT